MLSFSAEIVGRGAHRIQNLVALVAGIAGARSGLREKAREIQPQMMTMPVVPTT